MLKRRREFKRLGQPIHARWALRGGYGYYHVVRVGLVALVLMGGMHVLAQHYEALPVLAEPFAKWLVSKWSAIEGDLIMHWVVLSCYMIAMLIALDALLSDGLTSASAYNRRTR